MDPVTVVVGSDPPRSVGGDPACPLFSNCTEGKDSSYVPVQVCGEFAQEAF